MEGILRNQIAQTSGTYTSASHKSGGARWAKDTSDRARHMVGIGRGSKTEIINTHQPGDCDKNGVVEGGSLDRLGRCRRCRRCLLIPLTMGSGTCWPTGSRSPMPQDWVRNISIDARMADHGGPMAMQIITTRCEGSGRIAGENEEQAQRQQTAAREQSTRQYCASPDHFTVPKGCFRKPADTEDMRFPSELTGNSAGIRTKILRTNRQPTAAQFKIARYFRFVS